MLASLDSGLSIFNVAFGRVAGKDSLNDALLFLSNCGSGLQSITLVLPFFNSDSWSFRSTTWVSVLLFDSGSSLMDFASLVLDFGSGTGLLF